MTVIEEECNSVWENFKQHGISSTGTDGIEAISFVSQPAQMKDQLPK